MTDVITDPGKYRRGWRGGLPETPCGFGSRLSETAIQRAWLPDIIGRYAITSVADIGAGDLNWIKAVTLGCEYRAYDLVPRHPSVTEFNLLTDPCPQADLLLCLWVLNHFPPEMGVLGLNRLRSSGSKFLAMTWDSRLPYLDTDYIEQVQIRDANPGHHDGIYLRLISC